MVSSNRFGFTIIEFIVIVLPLLVEYAINTIIVNLDLLEENTVL